MGRIIYEKRYPRENWEALIAAETGDEQAAAKSFDEIVREVYGNRVCVPIPERAKAASAFVLTARRVSELYELDVTITEHTDHVSAEYYFNSSGGLRYLREVVKHADDISFFTNVRGYDIVMCLDFYTHTVFHRRRQPHS
mgnify:FL=1